MFENIDQNRKRGNKTSMAFSEIIALCETHVSPVLTSENYMDRKTNESVLSSIDFLKYIKVKDSFFYSNNFKMMHLEFIYLWYNFNDYLVKENIFI